MKITLDSHISISCTVGKAAVAGAVAGAVGVATFGLGTAVLGTGAAATVASGAVSGVATGQASIVMENILTGQEVTAGLGEPGDIAQDAFVGAALAGVGRSIDIVRMRARYSGYYSRYISEGELQAIKRTGLLRGGRSNLLHHGSFCDSQGIYIAVGFARCSPIPDRFSDCKSSSALWPPASTTLDLAPKARISCRVRSRILDSGSG